MALVKNGARCIRNTTVKRKRGDKKENKGKKKEFHVINKTVTVQ